MQFAVMIHETYSRYQPKLWITHTVEDDANKAYQKSLELKAGGYESKVVEYHSRDWENLVR